MYFLTKIKSLNSKGVRNVPGGFRDLDKEKEAVKKGHINPEILPDAGKVSCKKNEKK